jgi:hypothetical protein
MKKEGLPIKSESDIVAIEKPIEDKKGERNINKYLKEQGIEAPPVSLHIFYSAHKYAKDLEGFDVAMKDADIILLELVAWNEQELDLVRKVSKGDITPEEALKKSRMFFPHYDFIMPLLRKLYKSNKKIAIADLPEGNPIIKDIEDEEVRSRALFSDLFKKEVVFEEAIEMLKHFKSDNDNFVKREDYIASQLGPQVEKVLNDNKELLNQKNIRLLMFFGYGHNEFFHKIRADNPDTSREFTGSPLLFDYGIEIRKRREHNKPISDDLYAKSLLQVIMMNKKYRELFSKAETGAEIMVIIRKVVDKFSTDEIKEVYSHVRDENFGEYLDRVLEDKDIELFKRKKN